MRLDLLRSMRWPYFAVFVCLAVVAVVALVVLLPAGGDESVHDSNGLPYRSYAFEARMTAPDATGSAIIRGWYEAPSRTRWDIAPEGPEYGGWVRVLILTEKVSVFYEPGDNTYVEEKHAPGVEVPSAPFPLLSNIAIGPLVGYLDPATALPAGQERVLGNQGDVYQQGDVTWVLDPKRQFVMKQTFGEDHPMSSVTIEVTKVEFDKSLPASTWAFKPPADAKRPQVVASTPAIPASALTPIASPFLRPGYIPRGYVSGGGGSSANIEGVKTDRGNWSLGEKSFEIRQVLRPGGPLSAPIGTPVAVSAFNAVWVQRGDEIEIAWNTGELAITVSSSDLPVDELVKIAESLR